MKRFAKIVNQWLKAVSYFCKTLHLRCLTRVWIGHSLKALPLNFPSPVSILFKILRIHWSPRWSVISDGLHVWPTNICYHSCCYHYFLRNSNIGIWDNFTQFELDNIFRSKGKRIFGINQYNDKADRRN